MHCSCRESVELWSCQETQCNSWLTVSKMIEEAKCDLYVAIAWKVSAKNSLKNVNVSSLVFCIVFTVHALIHYCYYIKKQLVKSWQKI